MLLLFNNLICLFGKQFEILSLGFMFDG